jgi:hypothetical protein
MTPLINWLCAACTARHDQGPGQVLSGVAMARFNVLPADMELRHHCQRLLHAKLPDLLVPTAQPTNQAAYLNLLGHLENEAKLTREDAKDRANMVKTPSSYYGPTLIKHMRLAQVGSESGLPAMHHDQNGQKGDGATDPTTPP